MMSKVIKEVSLVDSMSKICKKCLLEKGISCFVKDKRIKSGHGAICLKCSIRLVAEYNSKRMKTDTAFKERIYANQKKWRLSEDGIKKRKIVTEKFEGSEKRKEYKKKYEKSEKRKEYHKKYYKMKKSAAKLASENIGLYKSLTASESEKNMSIIILHLSRHLQDFIDEYDVIYHLQSFGIDPKICRIIRQERAAYGCLPLQEVELDEESCKEFQKL